MKTYILKSVDRRKLKELTKIESWAGGKRIWSNLQYVTPTRTLWAETNKRDAINYARSCNYSRKNENIYYVEEIDLF